MKGYVAPSGAKLVLTATAVGSVVGITFENRGTAPVCLYTHVATDGEHFDWLHADVTPATGGAPRPLEFVDARDKSAPVSVELGPGDRITKNVDFAAWAKRAPNGSKALASGTWTANLSWDSTRESWAWAGTLHATTTFVVR